MSSAAVDSAAGPAAAARGRGSSGEPGPAGGRGSRGARRGRRACATVACAPAARASPTSAEPLARERRRAAADRSSGRRRNRAARAAGRRSARSAARARGRASTTAGRKFAAAVPEVQTHATGRRAAFARPRAKKAPRALVDVRPGARPPCAASARASGVERLPGDDAGVRDAGARQLGDERLHGSAGVRRRVVAWCDGRRHRQLPGAIRPPSARTAAAAA